jgi:glycosyltransferase involved in cell wall biosynthesis
VQCEILGLELHALDDYIVFLDSDDWLIPNSLKTLAKVIDNNYSYVIKFGRIGYLFENTIWRLHYLNPPLENRKPYASKYIFNKYPEASINEKYIRHYYEYFYFSKKKYFKILTLLTHFKNGGFNSAYTHIAYFTPY